MAKQHLYTVGGTVQSGSGLYIARQADTELLELCQAGTFAYVLSSRQMGKSSLMVRTSEQLMVTGTHAVVVDLGNLGTHLEAEAWYLGILTTIADSLMLSTDVVAWWQAHAHLGQAQRLTDFFQDVLLSETEAPVVIFIDEIDSTLSLPFTDDFYAAIRSVYNARALVPAFRRLSFVLLGVATPSELISDPRRTPFNIGQRVEVTDFTYEEALPLADGFGLPPTQAQQVLQWVLDWTGGHPYLTQRLCRVMADEDHVQWSETDVAQMVARTFFGEQSEQDHNLQFVRDMLTERVSQPVRVLATYRTIRQGQRVVRDEGQSLVLAHLKLSGVVRQVERVLRVRNRIYETVFDLPWVSEHWPVPWYRRVPPVVWGLLASLITIVFLGLLVASQQQQGRLMQEVAERETQARQEAQARQQEAEKARAEAERLRLVSLAQALAAYAPNQQEFVYQDERAVLLARQAYLFNQRSQGEVLDQIDNTLRAVLSRPYFQRVLRGHESGVRAVAFSPDGATLASASRDRTVRLWDLRSPEAAPRVLRGHEDEVGGVAFSPDGTTLASASGDRTIRLWDLRSPEATPRVLRGHEREVRTVAFSRNGMTLASASYDRTVRLWDLRSPEAVPRVLRGHEDGVEAVVFSPDSTILASASKDRTVRLWDLRSPEAAPRVLRGHEDWVGAVAFSPDGTTLASASGDRTVRLWDLRSPEAAPRVLRGHENGVGAVVFSPDGTTLASASYDRTVRLWDLRSPEAAPRVLRGYEDGVGAVVFSPDSTTLASASYDRTVRLWDLRSPEAAPRVLRGYEDGVGAVVFSPDGTTLASASYDRTVRLWDLRSPEAAPRVLRGHESGVRAVAFSPDGATLASASRDRTVRLWDLRSPEAAPRVLRGHEDEVGGVAFSPDGTTLASASGDRTIRLWDLRSPEATPRVLRGHEREVRTVAFSRNGMTLASASYDRTVRLWDLRSPEAVPRVLRGHEDGVEAVVFSPDSTILASASKDRTVRLWDLRSPEAAPRVLRGHEDWVGAVAFSPDGTTLASASGDRTVRLWDLRSPEAAPRVLRGHENGVGAVVFSPDGTTLASASYDRTVRLWMSRTEDLATLVCSTAWRNLMLSEWRQFVGRGLAYERTCPHLPIHPSVLQEAQDMARAGDLEAAIILFRRALTLDPLLAFQPETEANKWAAQGLLARGEALVRQGHVPEALTAYTEAQQRDPTLHISAQLWNQLCWFGSLWDQAAAVLHACEQAVTLTPDDGSIHQSRGIAQALTGNYNGAIADLQFFLTWGEAQQIDATLLAKRQSWIETLQTGRNPFDAATLEGLRQEEGETSR